VTGIALVRRCLALALLCAMSAPAGAGAVTTPASHSFAPTKVGASSSATLLFAAETAPSEEVRSLALSGPQSASFQVIDDQCTQRMVVAQCAVTIAFAPQSAGAAAATLRVVGDAGAQDVRLSGTGFVAGPQLGVAPAAVSFASAVDPPNPPRRAATITNSGDLAARIDAVVVEGAQASAFVVENDDCTATSIGPGGHCTVVLRFGPDGPGAYAAHLLVSASGAGPRIDIPLSGSRPMPFARSPVPVFAKPHVLSGAGWSEFDVTRASGARRQIKVQLYTTLQARVRLTVVRRRAVVARVDVRVGVDWSTLRIRGRFAVGRYLVKAEGRRDQAVRRARAWVTIRR
jgi:hypothetical protein